MFLGVEVGGTKLQVGVCNRRGRLMQLVRVAVVRRRGQRGILKQLEQIVPELISRLKVKAIGVGFGGPVDAECGRVVRSHQIAGWSGFELKRWCERQFRLPTALENDANAAALAEAVCGAGRGKRSVLYITVGTGIGGGFVLDGEIYSGRFGAMEIGHTKIIVDGKWVSVESVASGLAIERGVSTVPQAARYVGAALANAITLLNPETVIVGGGVSMAGDRFFRPLRATVDRRVFPPFRRNCRVVPAALGESVVVIGAALLASGEHGRATARRR